MKKIRAPKHTQALQGYKRLRHRIAGILSRCYNKQDKDYDKYGRRGIGVWSPWKNNRILFVKYLLTLPSHDNPNLQIDRINNDGDYCPGNIRFTTAKTNSNNRRNSHIDGEGTLTTCPTCDKEFTRKIKGQKFCSRICFQKSQRKEGSAGTNTICEYCKQQFTRNHKGQRFCGYSCSAKWRTIYGA